MTNRAAFEHGFLDELEKIAVQESVVLSAIHGGNPFILTNRDKARILNTVADNAPDSVRAAASAAIDTQRKILDARRNRERIMRGLSASLSKRAGLDIEKIAVQNPILRVIRNKLGMQPDNLAESVKRSPVYNRYRKLRSDEDRTTPPPGYANMQDSMISAGTPEYVARRLPASSKKAPWSTDPVRAETLDGKPTTLPDAYRTQAE